MLPIRDNIPSRRFPAITLALIAANTLVFLWELQLGPRMLERTFVELAIIPARYSIPEIAESFSLSEQVLPFFSSMYSWSMCQSPFNVTAPGSRRSASCA